MFAPVRVIVGVIQGMVGAAVSSLLPGLLRFDDRGALMERFLSRDARNFRPSAIRAFAKLINDPNVISFAGGVPSPETFPRGADRGDRGAGDPREARGRAAVRTDARTAAALRLRRRRLPLARRSTAAPTTCCITTGSQQALDLIAHTLLDPGDVVLVELPTYIGGTSSFHARSASSPASSRMTTASFRSRWPRLRRGRSRSCCTRSRTFRIRPDG